MIQKKVLILLSFLIMFLSICQAQVDIFDEADSLKMAGQSGLIHVSVDPDEIGLVIEQDSMYDAMLAWHYKDKVLYGYHPDSLIGNRWNVIKTTNADSLGHLPASYYIDSLQFLLDNAIDSVKFESDSISVYWHRKTRDRIRIGNGIIAVDTITVGSSNFIDAGFDLPISNIENELEVVRDGFTCTHGRDYTIGLDALGRRRRITFIIPLLNERVRVEQRI